MSRKHGNENAWCFLEDGWETSRPIEIWQSIGKGMEEVVAHATDRYNAMRIVDALNIARNIGDDPANQLSKKETEFLQFVAARCNEPWATMADNALTWNDRETYNNLLSKFPVIYS